VSLQAPHSPYLTAVHAPPTSLCTSSCPGSLSLFEDWHRPIIRPLPCTQVVFEAGSQFCVLAVIKQGRCAHASKHIIDNLRPALKKALKQHKPQSGSSDSPSWQGSPTNSSWWSPLQAAFNAIDLSFAKLHGNHDESIYPQAGVSACLLDATARTACSLSFGKGTQPCLLTDSSGKAVSSDRSRTSFTRHTILQEALYSEVLGPHSLIIGSPGLWCATFLPSVLCFSASL
jgi:hypothetical protein